jgi:hypothetical protein
VVQIKPAWSIKFKSTCEQPFLKSAWQVFFLATYIKSPGRFLKKSDFPSLKSHKCLACSDRMQCACQPPVKKKYPEFFFSRTLFQSSVVFPKKKSLYKAVPYVSP